MSLAEAPGTDAATVVLRRVTISACAAVLALVTAGECLAMTSQPPPVILGASVAMVVAGGGLGFAVADRSTASARRAVGLSAAGLASVVLSCLLPQAPGYLVAILVLIALPMSWPLAPALVTGLALTGATVMALQVHGQPMDGAASGAIAAAFYFTVGAFTRSARISRDQAHAARARTEELLAQLQESQAAQAEAVALAERTRLAREVHDILAHSLAGLVLALDTAELLGRRHSEDATTMDGLLEQIGRARRIARDGLADTRRAVSALRGDELPGPALFGRLARQTSEATGIEVTLAVHGQQRPLPPEIGLALYRTAQEALINTAKYAGRGGTSRLRLSYRPDDVALEIEDTRPADAAPRPTPAGLTFGGYGLTGMRERAELLGGRLTAGPTSTGFRVELWLPARVDQP